MNVKKFSLLLIVASLAAPSVAASLIPRPPELWVMNADGTHQRRVDSGSFFVHGWQQVSWSPDGTRLLTEEGSIYNPTTGAVSSLGVEGVQDARWSPVSEEVVFSKTESSEASYEEDLYVINSDGSGLRLLADTPGLDGPAAWSPDGTEVAFVSGEGEGEPGEVFVVNADGTGLRVLSSKTALYIAPEWAPDGTRLVFQTFSYQLHVVGVDGSDERPVVPYGSRDGTWCPDGTLYFVAELPTDPSGPVIQSIRGAEIRTVTQGASPDCSSTGKLAFSHNGDIHLLQPGGSGRPNLTSSDDREDVTPSWSPDATQLAFTSTPGYPPPTPVERNIGLALSGHLSAEARIRSHPNVICPGRLKVQRLSARGWNTVTRSKPDERGRIDVRLRDRAGYYRVVAPPSQTQYGQHNCLRAVSDIARHRH